MSSTSRGGGPAAMPKYQRIAAALRDELDRAASTPGGRLPSERSLAARYQVNRQTIRAALQHLREDGLVVTGRRGSRSVAATGTPAASGATPAEPAGPEGARPSFPVPAPTRSWLTHVTVAPSLAALLGMAGGERTLVHHRRERGRSGETVRDAVTYLSSAVVAEHPDLAAYRDRPGAVRDVELAPLHRWLDRAEREGRIAETITMTRTTHAPTAAPVCGLSVRRTLHDSAGRLLAVTDLAFPTWDRLTFHRDLRDSVTGGFRVT
ncbi:GntR family transcriptional regulator [Streptomyces sp. NPDC058662]|uniref:GntR family transcriptional regulator n=1 Tax=Streptomyces sp. NPDC058662 TaxID=3346583 RepID=UPI00366706AA